VELFLFTTDIHLAVRAEQSGIDSIIIDWESKGKAFRQEGVDLEINLNTPDDVRALCRVVKLPLTVRINSVGSHTPGEIDKALDAGAQTIMLPMAEHPEVVKEFLRILRGRARSIVQIETQSLVEHVTDLTALPWDYAYVGLNDLMLSRNAASLWEPLLDGTLDHIARILKGRAYGFGGLTVVGGGSPIPSTLLHGEMVRLGCALSVMRRTFKREILDRHLGHEIRAMRQLEEAFLHRGPEAIRQDHERLMKALTAG
jgi:2-keto-3-deoxy-L-rhamnonate aldolase RhmA